MDHQLVIDPKTNKYSRTWHTSHREITLKLNSLYLGETESPHTIVVPSGMKAIYTAVQTICMYRFWKPFNLVYSDELYSDTPKLLKYFANQFIKIKLYPVDVRDTEYITKLFNTTLKNQDNILYVESCTNPNGYIFDFRTVPHLRAQSKSLFCIVDNTWLSSVIFNPFDYDADIVVTSLTKYYSGGQAIAGAVVFKNTMLYDIADQYLIITGNHISPHDGNIINDAIDTVKHRIIKSSKLTVDVIESIGSTIDVLHPLVATHPSHELAKLFFNKIDGVIIYPSVFTFWIKLTKPELLEKMRLPTVQKYLISETSFGSPHSKTDPYPRPIKNTDFTTCRVAVGYDDTVENIINGIVLIDE